MSWLSIGSPLVKVGDDRLAWYFSSKQIFSSLGGTSLPVDTFGAVGLIHSLIEKGLVSVDSLQIFNFWIAGVITLCLFLLIRSLFSERVAWLFTVIWLSFPIVRLTAVQDIRWWLTLFLLMGWFWSIKTPLAKTYSLLLSALLAGLLSFVIPYSGFALVIFFFFIFHMDSFAQRKRKDWFLWFVTSIGCWLAGFLYFLFFYSAARFTSWSFWFYDSFVQSSTDWRNFVWQDFFQQLPLLYYPIILALVGLWLGFLIQRWWVADTIPRQDGWLVLIAFSCLVLFLLSIPESRISPQPFIVPLFILALLSAQFLNMVLNYLKLSKEFFLLSSALLLVSLNYLHFNQWNWLQWRGGAYSSLWLGKRLDNFIDGERPVLIDDSAKSINIWLAETESNEKIIKGNYLLNTWLQQKTAIHSSFQGIIVDPKLISDRSLWNYWLKTYQIKDIGVYKLVLLEDLHEKDTRYLFTN